MNKGTKNNPVNARSRNGLIGLTACAEPGSKLQSIIKSILLRHCFWVLKMKLCRFDPPPIKDFCN